MFECRACDSTLRPKVIHLNSMNVIIHYERREAKNNKLNGNQALLMSHPKHFSKHHYVGAALMSWLSGRHKRDER